MNVRGCIFDLGGTIVDKYSLTPYKSLIGSFKNKGINVNRSLIFKDMGISKKEHIEKILNDKYVFRNWYMKTKRIPEYSDVNDIFNDFKKFQKNHSKNINIIPETYSCLNYLKNNNIKVGCSTGFDIKNTKIITEVIKQNIYELDSVVSSSCVKKSRPHSDMIYMNMKNMNISSPENLIKIDDTNVGIAEGKNAGLWTVGVARWSTYMNILPNELNNLNDVIIQERLQNSRNKLKESNPDFIINTLDELPNIIKLINIYNKNSIN